MATDIRSDLYALGATLYHLLAGQLPPDSVDIITQSALPPPPVVDINNSISDAISQAITKAMALDREARWASARDFKAALTPVSYPGYREKKEEAKVVQTTMPVPQPWEPQVDGKPRVIPWRWIGVVGGFALIVLIGLVAVFFGLIVPQISKRPTPFSTTQVVEEIVSETTSSLLPTTLVPSVSTSEAPPISTTPPSDFTDDHGVRMNLIPAGSFEMGTDSEVALEECRSLYSGTDVFIGESCQQSWYANEEPVHTVYLDDYYIDLREVTNAMYALCVEKGFCTEPSDKDSSTHNSYYGNLAYADYPVIDVIWEQAQEYCEWRGARLPTEAEWEKAARGTEGQLYPWGNTFDGSLANFCDKNCTKDWANLDYDDGYTELAPVGTFPEAASPYGVLEMGGNVWEWVSDWYSEDYYANSPSENPNGPDSGTFRVARGGSWYGAGFNLRTCIRGWFIPTMNIGNDLGFRCAR